MPLALPTATAVVVNSGGFTGGTSYTAPAGSNRKLIALLTNEANSGQDLPGTTLSFGAQAMTLVASGEVEAATGAYAAAFELLEADIPAGAQVFAATPPAGQDGKEEFQAIVFVVENADQVASSNVATSAGAFGTDKAVAAHPSNLTAGSLSVGVVTNPAVSDYVPENGYSALAEVDVTNYSFAAFGLVAAADGPQTLSVDTTADGYQAAVVFEVLEAAPVPANGGLRCRIKEDGADYTGTIRCVVLSADLSSIVLAAADYAITNGSLVIDDDAIVPGTGYKLGIFVDGATEADDFEVLPDVVGVNLDNAGDFSDPD